jgi:hypothetical protein
MSGCALHGLAFTYGCPGCDEIWDDVVIAIQVRERLANDTGERLTLEEFAAEVGFDLDDPADTTEAG